MVIKVYISGISGNKEVKKRQQRVLMILDSKNIKYEVVDITEPGKEDAKEFMQNNAKCFGATIGDANPRSPLPPQIFSDDDYCGDYDGFDIANENDEIETFLKITTDDAVVTSSAEIKLGNGELNSVPVENENENEAEAKQDTSEDASTEKIVQDVIEDKTVTSETKDENETEDNKVENGNADDEPVSTEIAA